MEEERLRERERLVAVAKARVSVDKQLDKSKVLPHLAWESSCLVPLQRTLHWGYHNFTAYISLSPCSSLLMICLSFLEHVTRPSCMAWLVAFPANLYVLLHSRREVACAMFVMAATR